MYAEPKEIIEELLNYQIWAFEKTWKSIEQLTDEQFCINTGYSHGSIRNQMVHIISSTRRWFNRMQSQPPQSHINPEIFLTIPSLKKEWQKFTNDLKLYFNDYRNENWNEKQDWAIPSRNLNSENKKWEILLHLFNHATDHRTQVLAIIDLYFHKGTFEQDFIFFLTDK